MDEANTHTSEFLASLCALSSVNLGSLDPLSLSSAWYIKNVMPRALLRDGTLTSNHAERVRDGPRQAADAGC
jgi:hypothetical protein